MAGEDSRVRSWGSSLDVRTRTNAPCARPLGAGGGVLPTPLPRALHVQVPVLFQVSPSAVASCLKRFPLPLSPLGQATHVICRWRAHHTTPSSAIHIGGDPCIGRQCPCDVGHSITGLGVASGCAVWVCAGGRGWVVGGLGWYVRPYFNVQSVQWR